MHDCKPIDTPISKNKSLSQNKCPKTEDEQEKMAHVPYPNAIGILMYAMMCTWLDICYVVGLVSRFQSHPELAYWKAVKRILRYFKGKIHYVLCYQGLDLRLIC